MDRAQVHTLEAIISGLLLISSVVFALQMTAVTPLSASTSSQHIENQQQASAEGVLSMAAANDSLRESVLYWNSTGNRFHGATSDGYVTPMPTAFGRLLERTFGDRGIAYNVYVTFYKLDKPQRKPMIYSGVPSDNAVSATKTVTLTDGDHLRAPDRSRGDEINDSNFYANDNGDGALFDTVTVEVVVWRI